MKKYIVFNVLSFIIFGIFIVIFTPFITNEIKDSEEKIKTNNFENNIEKNQNLILSNFSDIHDKAILSGISVKNLFEKDLCVFIIS
jgi:predicted lipoprotein